MLQDTSGCLFLKENFIIKFVDNEVGSGMAKSQKNLCLFLELYHYIYKLQRIFYHVVQLCARVIFKKLYYVLYFARQVPTYI